MFNLAKVMTSPRALVSHLVSWVPDRDAKPTLPTVLIVDDEESVVRFVARTLQQAGYETDTAVDGPAALAAAARASDPFDLVITDLMMPDMNGDELVRRLRQRSPDLKVLYLTGFSDRLFAERARLWKDEAFLDKPCSMKGLLEAVSLASTGHIRSETHPSESGSQETRL
jgi:two-component system cell cycle sensor histidine kinase/response regulator CckA